jgi:hypothetical protein
MADELVVEKGKCHFEKKNDILVLYPCDPLSHFESPVQEPPKDEFNEFLYDDDNAEEKMKEQGFMNGLRFIQKYDEESGNIVKYAVHIRSYERSVIINYCPFCGTDLFQSIDHENNKKEKEGDVK